MKVYKTSQEIALLVEQHQKEIWEWKQKESEYIQTKNLLDGSRKIIAEMGKKMIEQTRVIKELEQEIERLVAENKK